MTAQTAHDDEHCSIAQLGKSMRLSCYNSTNCIN